MSTIIVEKEIEKDLQTCHLETEKWSLEQNLSLIRLMQSKKTILC